MARRARVWVVEDDEGFPLDVFAWAREARKVRDMYRAEDVPCEVVAYERVEPKEAR